MVFLCCLLGGFPVIESEIFPAELQQQVQATTVLLVRQEDGVKGSGAIIGQGKGKAYILTSNHVVGLSEKFEVHLFTQDSYPKPSAKFKEVRVLTTSDKADLALLQVTIQETKVSSLSLVPTKEAPSIHKKFTGYSVGCSLGKPPTGQSVRVLARKLVERPNGDTAFFWQTEDPPKEGRSGGPLIDSKGRLIGICSGKQDGKGYFTWDEEIRQFLTKEAKFDSLIEAKSDR
jgi:S1-C subfamily serine protease